MPRICASVLMLTIVALAASAAPAPDATPLGIASPILLYLRYTQVRQELKISEDQYKKLKKWEAERSKRIIRLIDVKRADRAKKREELQQESEATIAKILTNKQLIRAEQILLQLRGWMSWTMPQVAAALQLTDEQKEKLTDIRNDYYRDLRERREKEGITPEQRKELANTVNEKLMNVLTPSQKAKWKQLLGAPFKLDRDRSEE